MGKNIVFTMLLLLCVIMGEAQQTEITQSIHGKVIDKYSHEPLPGATVVVLNTSPLKGTTTDINGMFHIDGVSPGRHSLKISFVGYHDRIIKNVNVVSGKQLVLTVELEERVSELDAVVVKATSDKTQSINKMATVSARTFTVEETERFAGSLGDPSRMASHYAGVAMVNDQRNDIIIRGNSPATLLWRLDGIEIPNPNHFGTMGTTGGPVSMLNNNLLENSDFFTGAFPAEYGNAISGVFDLKMRSGNTEKREFVGQIGFNGFELGAEGPFIKGKNSTYLINYRYSTLDLMHKMGLNIGIGEAIPQYQDLSFKMDVPTQKYGRFTLLGIGGLSFIALHDSQKAAAGNHEQDITYGGIDIDFGSDMGVIGLKHLYFINKTTRIESIFSVVGSRNTTHVDSLKFDEQGNILPNSQFLFYDSKGTEIKYTLASHLKKKLDARNNFSAGVYYDIYEISLLDSARIHNQFRHQYDISGKKLPLLRSYGQFQHRFSERLTLNIGLYAQYVDLNREYSIEPRLGIKYHRGNNILSFGYGKHSATIPRVYYFLRKQNEDGTYQLPNTNTKMLKSHEWVVGYDRLLGENFHFKTESYYQYLYDVPVLKDFPVFSLLNTGDSFEPVFATGLINEGTGKNYGIEFTLEKFLDRGYYFLITSSLFKSKYKGYDGKERNSSFANNYIFNALGGYEIKAGKYNKITFDLSSVFAGGKPYVPIDLEASRLNHKKVYRWEEANVKHYDDYFRIDLRIGFKMNKRHYSQEWAMDLQNLTNHKNIFKEDYNVRTQEINAVYQTGFFPMFLYRINF